MLLASPPAPSLLASSLRRAAVVAALVACAAVPGRAQQEPAVPASAPAPQIEGGSVPNSHPSLTKAIRRQRSRLDYVGVEALIDSLGIRDGMSILDIGAGPGHASFLFAERLHGTGQVFATDIREDFVEHIRSQARSRGLTNLSGALVREDGVDDFYAQHRYDLVFLSNVYHCLSDRVAYFSTLRAFLKEGGRLVLVMYNQTPLFAPEDVAGADELAQALAGEPEGGPLGKHLSAATRGLAREPGDREAFKAALVADLNRLLTDPGFYRNFYRDSYFQKDLLVPAERDLANWLLMTLGEAGTLDAEPGRIGAKELRPLLKLNRLFVGKLFGAFLAQGGAGAYVPAGDANRHTSKYVMLRELGAAGFELARETRLSALYDALVMVPRERR